MGRTSEKRLSGRQLIFLALAMVLTTGIGMMLLHYDMAEVPAEPSEQPVYQATEAPAESTAPAVGQKLDINLASKEQLEALPGIGPSLAERIVAYRSITPFKQVRDLKKVEGIGDAKYRAVCDWVYVGSHMQETQ